MTEVVINQNDGFVSITATGGETSIDGDFPIYEKSHVTIKRTRSGTTTTGTLNTHYTIADNQLEVSAGFTAALAGTWTPATAGDIFTLLLDVPESRTTDFTQAGDFFAATLNRELDLFEQQAQQLRRDVNKAAHLADTSTISDLEIPDPEFGSVLGWNEDEDGLMNITPNSQTYLNISPLGIQLLSHSNASDWRDDLGLTISDDVQPYNSAIESSWSAYTPTISSGSGSIATVGSKTARYRKVGKTVDLQFDIPITSAGTAGTYCAFTLPSISAAAFYYVGVGMEISVGGKELKALISPNGTTAQITNYDNTSPFGSGYRFVGNITFETAV